MPSSVGRLGVTVTAVAWQLERSYPAQLWSACNLIAGMVRDLSFSSHDLTVATDEQVNSAMRV